MSRLMESIQNGRTYIIAEMSANHAGSLENALTIVRGAKEAGADCLKIQTYTADTLTIDCDNEYFQIHGGLWDGYKLHDLYKAANTPWEWHKAIKDACDKVGIDFLSTPFDTTAVDFLEELGADFYKIASFELPDIPLIEYCASKHKPMVISVGMGSVEDIQDALDACHRVGNRDVVLLKCCSEYPANWEDMHLGNIPDMKERFKVPIGLSDHSEGTIASIVGVSLGACVVEKHVCISHDIKTADSEFSMDLPSFAKLVQDIRRTEQIKKGPDYELTDKEKGSTIFRRSLFAIQDIREGEPITNENVRSIRPGYGIAPKYLKDMLGKPAKKSIKRGEPITKDFL